MDAGETNRAMSIVEIRCSDCDEVKPKDDIDLGADGAICTGCKTSIPEEIRDYDPDSDEVSKNEQESGKSEEKTGDNSNRDNETESENENAEREKDPLKESFNEQNPLEW